MQISKRLSLRLLPHRLLVLQLVLLLLSSFVIFTSPASAVIRFNDRSLLITNTEPGATTSYKVSLTYNNQAVYTTTVGSIDLFFCLDPIPTNPFNPADHACVAPAGLDVSGAVLSAQTGETGFTILSKTTNRIVLTRIPSAASETPSTYTFDNIINPTDTSQSFAIRLSDYPTADASGQLINLGSILSQVNEGVSLETQVPPQLIFCVGAAVSQDCTSTTGGWYSDMGTLDPEQTLRATSQMAVGTNATAGFVITANGPTLSAGTNIINSLPTPTISAPGNSQFGINLRSNNDPQLGNEPDGPFTNAQPTPNYNQPNKFVYNDGDVIASAPNVSLVRRFTVSYIVNSPARLHPGVYTTSLTYICSGRF